MAPARIAQHGAGRAYRHCGRHGVQESGYSTASRPAAAASVSAFLAKQKRITRSSRPSAKKADTGIAATPASWVR